MIDWRARGIGLRIGGHRGDPEGAPENTIAGFAAATALGADFVETDVRLSADGVPVLMHDPTLERTTDSAGAVAERTWAELSELDAGGWFAGRFRGERIPRLSDFLAWLRRHRSVGAELEAKAPGSGRPLADAVAASGMAARISICSFLGGEVAAARRACPEAAGVLLFDYGGPLPADALEQALACGATGADGTQVHAEDVERFHRQGLTLAGSTVNDVEGIARAISAGVDYVDSDRPRLTVAAARSLVAASSGAGASGALPTDL